MKLIELVPRSVEDLVKEAQLTLTRFPFLDGVNIPDVTRLPTRSHEAAIALAGVGITAIPHIRTIDRSLEDTVALVGRLAEHGVDRVLLVSGDRPKNNNGIHDVSPVAAIREIKKRLPRTTVYAGIDPYRSNLKTERDYIRQKQDAGVNGLFSQPFFDARLAEVYLDIVGRTRYLGISPVTSENSKNYWETVNQVVLPADYQLSLDHNAVVARQLMQLADDRGQHVYLMPIKTDIGEYLARLS